MKQVLENYWDDSVSLLFSGSGPENGHALGNSLKARKVNTDNEILSKNLEVFKLILLCSFVTTQYLPRISLDTNNKQVFTTETNQLKKMFIQLKYLNSKCLKDKPTVLIYFLKLRSYEVVSGYLTALQFHLQ